MKVVDLKTMVVENEPPYRGGRYWLFLEIKTDEGITGIGERVTGNTLAKGLVDLKSHVSLIEEMGRQYVIGENPFNIERIWDRMYASRHDFRHPSLQATLRAYAYMPGGAFKDNPEAAGEVAVKLLEEGNSACKLDPFSPLYPLPRDIPLWEIAHAAKIFESIRKAVGDKLEVGIGTHGQMTTSSAIRIAHILEPYHPFWFEEPVPPENVDEMARVAAHTSIPIATGERLVTKYEFLQVLEKRAAQIIQLDVGQCGGIMESKKIASIAEAHYATIAPHMGCGPIAAAAAIQVATCSPNLLILEDNGEEFHRTILKEPPVFENGFITPPTGPGLGVEFDEDVLKAHLVE